MGVPATTVNREADDNTTTLQASYGLEIEPQTSLSGIDVEVSGNTADATSVVLADDTGTVLAKHRGQFSAGDRIRLHASLSAGTPYYVGLWNDGNDWDRGYNGNSSFPYTSDDVDLTAQAYGMHPDDDSDLGTYDGNASSFFSVSSVTEPTSASVTAEWPMPADVYGWDATQYLAVRDGETVDVYVEEDQAGGWTEIAGPISRGQRIHADADNNVRYRVEFSRADAANNPRLESLVRRAKL